MLYICIATFNCPKGILGLGGGKHLKQTERRQFHLLNDKRHNFKYISYACAEGIPQSFENEGRLYPKYFFTFTFLNPANDLLKLSSKRHPVLRRKMRGGSRRRKL